MKINPLRLVPDSITCGNLVCGLLGTMAALAGHFDQAFYLMLGAAACDYCDGFSARALGVSSDIGKELDSLADLVSFGILPAVCLFGVMKSSFGLAWFSFLPLVIAPFSAVRLAKYNLDTRQTLNFIGLATPACASICCSLACYVQAAPDSFAASCCATVWFLPAIAFVLSFLLVSELPTFSMKFKKDEKSSRGVNLLRILFLALCPVCLVVVLLLKLHWSLAVLLSFTAYVLMNLVYAVVPGK